MVDTDDLLLVGIHYGDQWQGESVEVGIGVAITVILGKDQALEVAAILIRMVKTSVWPWFNHHLESGVS